MTRAAQHIVQEWLTASARTAAAGEHEAFMALISEKVSLLGVPGFEIIKYDDWSRQCKDEFEDGLVKRIIYERAQVVAAGLSLIMFRAVETVEASDGPIDKNGIEGVLERESDGRWRLTQERILSLEEAARYELPVG